MPTTSFNLKITYGKRTHTDVDCWSMAYNEKSCHLRGEHGVKDVCITNTRLGQVIEQVLKNYFREQGVL